MTVVLFSMTDRGLVQLSCGSIRGPAELSPPAERREYPSWPGQTLHAPLFPHIRPSESLRLTAPPHRRLESSDLSRRTRGKRRKQQEDSFNVWLLLPVITTQFIPHRQQTCGLYLLWVKLVITPSFCFTLLNIATPEILNKLQSSEDVKTNSVHSKWTVTMLFTVYWTFPDI